MLIIIAHPSKSSPKAQKHFVKVHPKSTKIAPKSCPKSILDPKRVPKPSPTRFFRFFIDFLSLRGFPKSSQNREKSKKSDEKSMSKKHMVFNTFFSRFFMVLAAKSDSKIEVFSYFFRRRRFFENEQKPLKNSWFLLIFQVSSLQKSTPNRC